MSVQNYFLSPVFVINFDNGLLKTDWEPTDYYNFEDINRVERYTKEVAELVAFFRSKTITLSINMNREVKAIEFADSMNRIEGNIKSLGEELKRPTGLIEPKVDWWYNTPFSFEDANRLEKNLKVLLDYIQGNINNLKYCGTYTCGDEGVI